MKFTQALAGSLLTFGAYSASVPHVVHEQRTALPLEWERRSEKPSPATIIPLSFALTQRNLDLGPDYLMKVSDPDSSEYGQHWSAQKVVETFAPTKSVIAEVKSWLVESGISPGRIKIANGRHWIYLNATLREAEKLLKTEYKLYGSMRKRAVACDEYSLPVSVRGHIDFVKPTIQLSHLSKREIDVPNVSNRLFEAASTINFPTGPPISSWDLTYCNNYTSTGCIRALYNMPNGTLNISSYGVVEFAPYDTYLASDLQLYLQQLNPQIPETTVPAIELIDQTSYSNTTAGRRVVEALLDLDLAISLAYPQQIILISSPYVVTGPGQNDADYILEGFDASYCDIAAANTTIHGTCGGSFLPSVLSVSWAGSETPGDAAVYDRLCNEFMKLSLQGHTLLFPSGDYGVAASGMCCINPGCYPSGVLSSAVDGATFLPTFPATCPWITAVGGTRIAEGASIKDKEVAAHQYHYYTSSTGVVTNTSWSGGGGFSNLFARPKYQEDALNYYYRHHAPNYTAQQYNNSQHVRGYPDISANGVNTLIYYQGAPYLIGGTSASCPIVGSIITLINEQRLKAGKSVVGFINPVLYKNPHAFNDIVEGNNPGCKTDGFQAVPGWDPITGLGTPDYRKLLKVFMDLP